MNTKQEKIIYVFDFDDTLVMSSSCIRIYDENDELVACLTPSEYHYYEVESNHRVDYSEFDEEFYSIDPFKINKPVGNIFNEAIEKFGKENVYICSARVNPKPIQNVIEKLFGHSNINIAAVGYNGTNINSTAINAIRKKKYIRDLVLKEKPNVVYFYDDNDHNLREVHSLRKDEHVSSIASIRSIEVNNEYLRMLKDDEDCNQDNSR